MTVYIEKEGPVTTIVLSRPGVRNAVDRDAAQELADAFHSFEIDKAYFPRIENAIFLNLFLLRSRVPVFIFFNI